MNRRRKALEEGKEESLFVIAHAPQEKKRSYIFFIIFVFGCILLVVSAVLLHVPKTFSVRLVGTEILRLFKKPSSDIDHSPILEAPSHSIVPKILTTNMVEIASYRVAIIVVYTGVTFPQWFDSFALTASASSSLCDWLVFVTSTPARHLPRNIKMHKISKESLYSRLISIDDSDIPGYDTATAVRDIGRLLETAPHLQVEFKPCLGYAFADYLTGYSHWAFADIDQLIGPIHSFLTNDVLSKYDVYSSSFGDNYRLYMRGQLTIHKNNEFGRGLWKWCTHLYFLRNRLRDYASRNYTNWRFQSAEGCYGKAVNGNKNATVYYSVTQLTDAYSASRYEKETMLLGSHLFRCYENPLELSEIFEAAALPRPDRSSRSIARSALPLQPLSFRDYPCAYWIKKEFTVCIDKVPAQADIFLRRGGKLEYQAVDRYNFPVRSSGGVAAQSKCRVGAVSHFQGWKYQYYTFSTTPAPPDAHAIILSDSGFLPLRFDRASLKSMYSLSDLPTVRSWTDYYNVTSYSDVTTTAGGFENTDVVVQAYGRVSHLDLQQYLSSNNGGKFKTIPRLSDSGEGATATSYCAGFSADLKTCRCPILGSHITVFAAPRTHSDKVNLRGGSGSSIKKNDVTMITAAWYRDYVEGRLDRMLDSWKGPKIVVLGDANIDQVSSAAAPAVNDQNVIVFRVRISHCLKYLNATNKAERPDDLEINAPDALGPIPLPDNMLLNMGLDAAATPYVYLSPAGFVVDSVTAATLAAEVVAASESIPTPKLHATLGVFRPAAMVLPMYLLQPARFDLGLPAVSRVFPSRSQGACGEMQPNFLGRALRHHSADNDTRSHVPFKAQDFLREKTIMHPVVFSPSASQHGTGFVRLPEELNGEGCYGTALLRILGGAGYSLFWSQGYAKLDIAANLWSDRRQCYCAHSVSKSDNFNRDESTPRIIASLQRYYLRAVKLRREGISKIFAVETFGQKFEREQKDLMAATEPTY